MAQPSPKGKGKMADSDEDRDFHSRKRHNSSASSNSTITGAPLSPGNVAHSPGETSDQGAAGISGMARSRTMTVLTSPPRFPGTPGREIHLHENGNNRKAFIVECESPDSSAIDDLVDDSVDGSAGGSVDGSVSGLSHAEWSSSVHTTPAAKLAVPEVQSNTTTTTATLAGPNPSGGQNIGITATPTMGTQINNLIEYVEAAGAQATISEGHVSNLDRSQSVTAQGYNDGFITNIGGNPAEYTATVNAHKEHVNLKLKRTISERVQSKDYELLGSGTALLKQIPAPISDEATFEHKLYHRGLAHQKLVGSTDEEAVVVITNFTPAIPVFIASPSRRIPASSSATIVVRDFSVTPRERRAIKREARRQRARRHDEPLTSENLEKLNNEVNAYQKSQQELTGHPTNDNNDSRGDSPIGRTPPTPIIAPQANIPGFNNEGSYLVALRSISNLDLGAAVSTIPSASGSSPRQPLLRTQSVVKKCNNASQQLIAKNIAVVASVDHERRRPAREKAAKTANMLSELSADADKKYAEAEADSKKMKTTPYPSELAKIEEAARKERFRKKVPEFWCRFFCFKA